MSQIRDRQIALSIGTPMIINDQDCDIEPLTVEHFPHDPPETAKYMILQAELNETGRTSSKLCLIRSLTAV